MRIVSIREYREGETLAEFLARKYKERGFKLVEEDCSQDIQFEEDFTFNSDDLTKEHLFTVDLQEDVAEYMAGTGFVESWRDGCGDMEFEYDGGKHSVRLIVTNQSPKMIRVSLLRPHPLVFES